MELHRKSSEVIISIDGLATKLFPNSLTMDSEREKDAEQWVCEHLCNPTTVRFQESHFKMQLGLKQTVFNICRSSLFFFCIRMITQFCQFPPSLFFHTIQT